MALNESDWQLKAVEVERTIEQLCLRIEERFPASGLARVCRTLLGLARETQHIVEWISRPNRALRVSIGALVALLLLLLFYPLTHMSLKAEGITLTTLIQATESALNELVLIGAGVAFLVTYETRRKRRRVIQAVNRLRSLAHIVDAHQLTKDPGENARVSHPTPHSPKRDMSDYELSRYLDYCAEMFSMISKLGFLYVQNFPDPEASDAVNDLEDLANGFSRKVWQKLVILLARRDAAAAATAE